mmetsp:Transcript_84712/g.240286  ORF Transcript_84712/g.240286 Transcript_84712/m.240286 type:complete len:103 (+) Transcript_84712:53-361(+)
MLRLFPSAAASQHLGSAVLRTACSQHLGTSVLLLRIQIAKRGLIVLPISCLFPNRAGRCRLSTSVLVLCIQVGTWLFSMLPMMRLFPSAAVSQHLLSLLPMS